MWYGRSSGSFRSSLSRQGWLCAPFGPATRFVVFALTDCSKIFIGVSVIIMEDKTITCRDCNAQFVFTVSEQEFFAQKGFTNEPGRCPDCRAARKSQRNDGGYTSGGYSSSGGYGGARREMFPAVCAQCGKETQVPFQPRGDRPVYCSECYATQRPSTGGYSGGRSTGGGRSRY